MVLALLLALGQFVPAFLTLDLIFRYMPVEPGRLRGALRRLVFLFGGLALVFGLVALWLQFRFGGVSGALVGVALNGVPWWLLWRFGLRKQFTFLFTDREKPSR